MEIPMHTLYSTVETASVGALSSCGVSALLVQIGRRDSEELVQLSIKVIRPRNLFYIIEVGL